MRRLPPSSHRSVLKFLKRSRTSPSTVAPESAAYHLRTFRNSHRTALCFTGSRNKMRTSNLTPPPDESVDQRLVIRCLGSDFGPDPKVAKAIAHDLNNVFSLIKMATELLRTSPDRADGERFLEIIETGLSRGEGISRRVMDLSKSIS